MKWLKRVPGAALNGAIRRAAESSPDGLPPKPALPTARAGTPYRQTRSVERDASYTQLSGKSASRELLAEIQLQVLQPAFLDFHVQRRGASVGELARDQPGPGAVVTGDDDLVAPQRRAGAV